MTSEAIIHHMPNSESRIMRASAFQRATRWCGMHGVTVIAGAFVTLMLLLAAVGQWITPYDPMAQSLALANQSPSSAHWLGTDQLGRDTLSRLIVGSRTAVLGPLVIALVTTFLSTTLGLIAGFMGDWWDVGISRFLDVVYALPPLLVAIVTVGVLGGGFGLALVVLAVLHVPAGYRTMRAASLAQRSLPYVEAVHVLGRSRVYIMVKHVLPNIRPVMFSTFFLAFTYSFVDLSTLSFLGLGVAPGTPDWGRMAAESRVFVFDNPGMVMAPLILIVLTAVSANLLGGGLDRRSGSPRKAR